MPVSGHKLIVTFRHVNLACRAVVLLHTFNFNGFGPANLQARHPKYQSSCRQAETLSSFAAVSTFWAKPSRLPGYVIPVFQPRYEMQDPTFVAEL
jgi:hypothetical protein